MNDCFHVPNLNVSLLTLSCLLFQPFIRTVVRTLFILFLHTTVLVLFASLRLFVRPLFVCPVCLR